MATLTLNSTNAQLTEALNTVTTTNTNLTFKRKQPLIDAITQIDGLNSIIRGYAKLTTYTVKELTSLYKITYNDVIRKINHLLTRLENIKATKEAIVTQNIEEVEKELKGTQTKETLDTLETLVNGTLTDTQLLRLVIILDTFMADYHKTVHGSDTNYYSETYSTYRRYELINMLNDTSKNVSSVIVHNLYGTPPTPTTPSTSCVDKYYKSIGDEYKSNAINELVNDPYYTTLVDTNSDITVTNYHLVKDTNDNIIAGYAIEHNTFNVTKLVITDETNDTITNLVRNLVLNYPSFEIPMTETMSNTVAKKLVSLACTPITHDNSITLIYSGDYTEDLTKNLKCSKTRLGNEVGYLVNTNKLNVIITNDTKDDYKEMVNNILDNNYLEVSLVGCKDTIWSMLGTKETTSDIFKDPKSLNNTIRTVLPTDMLNNLYYRINHDVNHFFHGLSFKIEDEIELARREIREVGLLVGLDTMAQAMYYSVTKTFVTNQLAFMRHVYMTLEGSFDVVNTNTEVYDNDTFNKLRREVREIVVNYATTNINNIFETK